MILLLQYTLIFASVLILVALGGCFAEHSGVINLGLEGIMIMGALGGALTMRYVPNTAPAIVMILAVILVSALVGMVYSCLLAVASINFKADQTLVGTALNLLGTAGATVIVKAINTAANPDDVSSIVQYGSAKNALLAPIGSFEFNWFMLVAFIALVTAYVTLYKTRFGLRLMACGEHPQAAASVGINVYKMRWAGVLISGVLGGIGGIVFITAGVSNGYQSELVSKNAPYDIIFANILARPLIEMAPDLAQNLKSGGFCILSGFVGDQENWVIKAHEEQGLSLVKIYEMDNWRAALMEKRS